MSIPPGAQSSGLLQLLDERNILLGNGIIYYGVPLINLGQIKGDASFNYSLRPYDVVGGNPLILLRRFTLEERVNVNVPLLELQASSIALWFRNFLSGATTIVGTPSGGGTLYSQQFGGSAHMPFSVMRFEHPTPEGGYIAIQGFQVYPPLELRLPFPEQRETIYDAVFEFKHDISQPPGAQLGQFDVFVVPLLET
jgi:hypothetical protein